MSMPPPTTVPIKKGLQSGASNTPQSGASNSPVAGNEKKRPLEGDRSNADKKFKSTTVTEADAAKNGIIDDKSQKIVDRSPAGFLVTTSPTEVPPIPPYSTDDDFGEVVENYKELYKEIFSPERASVQSELFWRGVVHSYYVHNNKTSEMAQVMASVGPIIDRPIEVLFLLNKGVFNYDRNVKITPLIKHPAKLEDCRPDLVLGFNKYHVNTLYQRKEYDAASVGDVIVPFFIGEDSKDLNKDFVKLCFLLQIAYDQNEIAFGQEKDLTVFGYTYYGGTIRYYYMHKNAEGEYHVGRIGDFNLQIGVELLGAAVFSWRLFAHMKEAFSERLKKKAQKVVDGTVALKTHITTDSKGTEVVGPPPSKQELKDSVAQAQALLKTLTISTKK